MPSRSSLNVSLTPQLERFIESRVATGRYQTASEVIREGLRLLEFQERDREAAFKALKKKLRRAAGQARRGELVDGETFFEQLFTRLGQKNQNAPGGIKRYQLTPEAQQDLDAIAEYIAREASVVRAIEVLTRIRHAFRKLAEMPGMGHYREQLLGRRYRFWSVYSYLVVYRWDVDPIQILAVVHGARDLGAFLGKRLA